MYAVVPPAVRHLQEMLIGHRGKNVVCLKTVDDVGATGYREVRN
jgi:hypothetical protein